MRPSATARARRALAAIFVAPVDGSSPPIRLTHNRWEDGIPCWGVIPRD